MKISLDTAEVLKLTKSLIKQHHYAHLMRWKDRLRLRQHKVILFVYPFDGTTLARMWIQRAGPRSHGMGLSTRTLETKDWQDSVIHELLHLKIWTLTSNRNVLTRVGEESLVSLLAPLLSKV